MAPILTPSAGRSFSRMETCSFFVAKPAVGFFEKGLKFTRARDAAITARDINAQAEPPQLQTEILKDYIPRPKLAADIGKSVKTLVRWELDGRGPPVTRIGRDVLYYIPSVQKWLRQQEQSAA
jgi:hypothetical protein